MSKHKHADECLASTTTYNRGCHAGYAEALNNLADDIDQERKLLLDEMAADDDATLKCVHMLAGIDLIMCALSTRRAKRG